MPTFILLFCALAAQDVSFEEAIALGQERASVKANEEALKARQDGDRRMGGTLQPSQLTLMPGVGQSPDNERGFEWQANFLQGFNLKGLGGARRKTAQLEREALAQEVKVQALKARLEAARFWLQLRTLESLESLLESEVRLAESNVTAMERAFNAGMGTAADVAEAQAGAAELEQERLVVEGLRFEAAAHLARAMGKPLSEAQGHPPLATRGEVPKVSLPPLETLTRLAIDFDRLPEARLQTLLETSVRARAREVSAEFAPVLQVGAQFEQTMDKTLIGYGVATLTFDVAGNGKRDFSQAQSQVEASRWQTLDVRQRAQTEWVLAVHEVEHTVQQYEAIEERGVPAARALRERREALLKAGEGTVFEWLSARRKETQALIQRERILGARRWAEVQMMLLLSELP